MRRRVNLAVFCDFDGTIARRDVGYHLFHHFSGGQNDTLIPDWKAGKISSREILEREARMVQATPDEVLAFIDQFDIDPSFIPFERLCRSADIPVIVVSEGLDIYIRRILASHGLEQVPVICNMGHLEDNGIRIEFPHHNRTCRSCGSCKGERIAEYRELHGGSVTVVFAGDGYSDACAAREADIVFAKKDLKQYCQTYDIPYNAYSTFQDVTDQLVEQGYLATRFD
jgi:2-hydroxy-3-keto-5-methylthiopentenyl-1-phosphate phosphatase